MDTAALASLISLRRDTLVELIRISRLQLNSVQAGHMNDLMSLLAEKQAPLNRLSEISTLLQQSINEDPDSRIWQSDAARVDCRTQNDECELMLAELIRLEAECESVLTASRETLHKKLTQVDGAKQASDSYASNQAVSSSGNRLDLSSD